MLAPERDIIVPQGRPSMGPKVSGLEAFKAVYDEQQANYSVFGAEHELQEMAEANRNRVKQLTGKDIPLAGDVFGALGFEDVTSPLGTLIAQPPQIRQRLIEKAKQDNAELKELKTQYPDIQTYDEMVAEVRRQAAEREAHAEEVNARSGPWAKVTGFFGGMVGSFTTNDPLNIISLGLAGGGRTLATRVLTEVGLNSTVEGINQFMGVTGNRRLLGREFTTEQKVLNTLFAGAGAGLLRVGGEGFSAGIRKLSKKVKEGRAISRDDLNEVLKSDPSPGSANRAAQMALDAETQIRDLNPFDRSRASQAVHEALYARAHKQITEPFDPSELEVPRSSTAKAERDFIDEALAARGIREDDLIQQARDTFARLREVPQNLEQARTLALREREGKIREELSAEAGQKLTRAEVKKLQAEQKQLRKQIEELDRSFKETATKPAKKKGAKRKAPPKDAAQQRKAAETRLEETEAKIKAHERGAKAEADLSRLEQGKFPEAYKAELEGRARELEALAEHFVRETAPAARGYSAHEAMTTVDDLETRLSENLDEVVDAQVETAIRGMDDGEAKADLGLADDVDLDMKLKVVDDEGNVTGEITVREALQDIKADDALVRAVRECGV